MPNVQMDPLLDIIAVAEATNIVEHDIAYSNGYLVVAWLNPDGEVRASVVDYATGTVVRRDELVSTASDACRVPLLAATAGTVAVFWAVDADNEIQAAKIVPSASGVEAGWGSPSVLATDHIGDANEAALDVSVSGTTATPLFVLAYAKDDGANFEGFRVVTLTAGLSVVSAYELDLDDAANGVAVLGKINDGQIWALSGDATGGTQIYLFDTVLSLDANFPRTLDSATCRRMGMARVGDTLDTVIAVWQSSTGAASLFTNHTGIIKLNVQDNTGSLSLTATTYRQGLIVARPQAVQTAGATPSVWIPVRMTQGAGAGSSSPADTSAYVLDLVDPDGTIRPRHTPVATISYGGGLKTTPPHWATDGVSHLFLVPRALRFVDKRTASVSALTAYKLTLFSSSGVGEFTQGLAAEFAGSLYFANPLPKMYDGHRVVDVGFTMRSSFVSADVSAIATGGAIDQGTYQYMVLPEWIDGVGRRHQGAPCNAVTVDLSATTYASAHARVGLILPPLTTNLKGQTEWGSTASYWVVYRTLVGPQQTFYRLGGPWPETTATSTYEDDESDGLIGDNEVLYISAGQLVKEHPPAAHHWVAHGDRLFGIDAENRSRIIFSAPLLEGDGPHFSSVWQIVISGRGDLNALASMDGKLYAFTDSSVMLAAWGDGPAATNAGGSFPQPQLLSADAGCSDPRSVVVGPDGVFFAGPYENTTMIFLCPRGDSGVIPIGAPVRDTLESYPTITSAVVIQHESQVRFTAIDGSNGSTVLVYDYSERGEDGLGTWYVWGITGNVVHSAPWQGVHAACEDAGDRVMTQGSGATTLSKAATLANLWPAGLMTPARLKAVNVVGSVVSSSSASGKPTVSVDFSYDGGASFSATNTFAIDEASGAQFVRRAQPRQQRLTSGDVVLRLRLTNGSSANDEVALNAIMIESNPDGDGPRLGSGSRN
jgi:hypothetical protein